MKLSVVTTLYKSAPYIAEFHRRISAAASAITSEYEIIFVDDGSPDDSLEQAVGLQGRDPHVTVVELSRNFGHHKAMMTGLEYASGDYVLMIDTDLEEAPELLGVYWEKMLQDEGCDVVYGKLEARKGSVWEKATGGLFYRVLNVFSGENMPSDIAFSRLMTGVYVKNLLRFREREMYIGGLWHIAGFNQVSVPVRKSSKGISSYTLRRKLEMVINAVTSFSSMPLRLIFHLGVLITGLSLCLSCYYAVRHFLFNDLLGGWTSLIVVILLMSGLIMLSLGIIAIYLSKVFIEVKHRPYTIVRKIFSERKFDDKAES